MNISIPPPPPKPDTLAVLESCPPTIRNQIDTLRNLIFEIAVSLPCVGKLTETLKWGQLSYLTNETKSGTTIRLGWDTKTFNSVSLFVHCQTTLVAEWQTLFGDELTFINNREIRLPAQAPLPVKPLEQCISMALTYHSRKSK